MHENESYYSALDRLDDLLSEAADNGCLETPLRLVASILDNHAQVEEYDAALVRTVHRRLTRLVEMS